jgi:hypothetical protein
LRPEKESDLPPYHIVIDEVSGGEIANIMRGYILVNSEKIRFKGIAYGRYGGQNVAPRLSPIAKKRIKEIFGSVSKLEEDLQLKLVSGDFEMQPKEGPAQG